MITPRHAIKPALFAALLGLGLLATHVAAETKIDQIGGDVVRVVGTAATGSEPGFATVEIVDTFDNGTGFGFNLTDEAIDFIKTQRDQPFYLHLAYYTVHTPLQARPEREIAVVRRADRSVSALCRRFLELLGEQLSAA